ncbi:hypothetical protein [Gluconobacter sp. Dm-62]|uniref:hypothetical protein n=1 Tax=Gluconobacter sp. Dm-62 TaxID=2799804 RepID=UPI002012150B|nr:hypothetical protein [Gluconobacter sp. Dm-62]
MPFSNHPLPINPTKAPGAPDERERFDPYPDKSPITDEPPEDDAPQRDETPVLPNVPENPTNRIETTSPLDMMAGV